MPCFKLAYFSINMQKTQWEEDKYRDTVVEKHKLYGKYR